MKLICTLAMLLMLFAATALTGCGSSGDVTGLDSGGDSVLGSPTGLKVDSSTSSTMTVSWNAASGGTGGVFAYKLYLNGVYKGNTAATPSSPPATTYTFRNLTAGTTYTVQVASSDLLGTDSALSAAVSFTPTTGVAAPAFAPAGVASVPGDGSVVLNWEAAPDATAYLVYRGTSSGTVSAKTLLATVSGTTATDAAVVNGTTYYYQVIARNSVGDSPASPEITVVPAAGGASGVRGESWQVRAVGEQHFLNGVVRSGSQYLAVGDSGTILTSTDGAAWTARSSGTTEDLNGIAWSGSRYVAVGGWNGNILTSDDGITWTKRSTGVAKLLRKVIWSGSQFVAVGMGTILTSPDGIAWTSRAAGTTKEIANVVWTGSQFVAIGGSNGALCLTSPDGIAWTGQSGLSSVYGGMLFGLAQRGGQLVATGAGGTILTSSNGVNWAKATSGTALALDAVTWAGDRYIAVGSNGGVLTSPDGATWTPRVSNTTSVLSDVACSGTSCVAVGGTTTSGTVVVSP